MGHHAERLLAPWAIGLFAIGMSAILALLFPQARMMSQLVNPGQPDMVSVTFLENLLRQHPEDARLRVLLSNHLWESGQIQAAAETMAPLLSSPNQELRVQALLFELRLAEVTAFAAAAGEAEREAELIRMGKIVEALLAEGVDRSRLPGLAESAMVSGHPALAYHIYRQLADQAEEQAGLWYAKAGELALGQGWYRQAAAAYFAAQTHAASLDGQRRFYLSALRSLQAGNLLTEALVEAERHLGTALAEDDATLEFLVQLGRAAGNGNFAQKYVKQLLRPKPGPPARTPGEPGKEFAASWWDLITPRVGMMPAVWSGRSIYAESRTSPFPSARVVSTRDSQGPDGTGATRSWSAFRPFDDRVYSLAYQVFVENRNLSDAFRVASQAVQEAPSHLEWRRRLAQVAEWTGRPLVALAQWRRLAEHDPDLQLLDRIRTLAPAVYDDESLVWALTRLDAQGHLPAHEWRQLSDAFERIGQPEKAIRYLLHRYDRQPDVSLLEHVARLYQRMGDGPGALSIYERLEHTYGPTVGWAMQKAVLLAGQGLLPQAYEALRSVQEQARSLDESYWTQVGQLAWTLQDDVQAEQAYRRLWERKALSAEQRQRLIELVQVSNPAQAIDLSLQGWTTHRQAVFLMKALDLLIQGQQWETASRLFKSLSSQDISRLSDVSGYWMMRAEVMWKIGEPQAALKAYQEALARYPGRPDMREALLWFLIEHRQLNRLHTYLKMWAQSLREESRLWEAAAAAYQLLDDPERALVFFRLALPDRDQDYLWLMNFAQTLDAASHHARAWQVRQYVWTTLRRQWFATHHPSLTPEGIQAYVQLAFERAPTDRFHRWVRRLAKDRPTPVIHELMLSWFLSRDLHDAARWWLWKNYAKALERPAWASLAVALAQNDWVAIDRLVRTHAQQLITQDTIVAAQHLQRFPLAQTQSFDALRAQPDRSGLHRLFQDATIPEADRLDSSLTVVLRKPLSSYRSNHALLFNLGRFSVKPEIRTTWQASTDATELVGVPRVDQRIGGTVGYRLPHGRLEVTGQYRQAVSNFEAVKLRYQRNWTDHFTTTFELGRNQEAPDSVALLVGGVKDVIRVQGAYRLAKREFLGIQLEAPWFFSQRREKLARGFGVEGSVGHRFRGEYPDWSIRMQGRVQRYSREKRVPAGMARLLPGSLAPTLDLIVPQSFEQGGVTVSAGDSIRETFMPGNGIRLFGSVGGNYNSIFGVGYSAEGGLTTSLLGRDRLILSGSHIRGGFGRNSTTTQFTLHYQLLF